MSSPIPEQARQQILQTATGMIRGEIPLIEGARKLCNLRHQIGASDSELFNVIVGFESQTDDYPIGHVREAYTREALLQLDAEIAMFMHEARPAVHKACQQIIEAFS